MARWEGCGQACPQAFRGQYQKKGMRMPDESGSGLHDAPTGQLTIESGGERWGGRDAGLSSGLAIDRALESFLLLISAEFARVPAAGIDKEIDEWLGRLARFLDIERCSLWELSPDETTFHCRHTRSSSESPTAQMGLASDLSGRRFNWLREQSLRGQAVAWACVPWDIPPDAVDERNYALEWGYKAILSVPVLCRPSLYLLKCACTVGRSEWSAALVFGLQLIAFVFARAIERSRTEVLRQAMEARHRAVLHNLADLMFVVSPDGTYLDYYARDESLLLAPPEAFLGRNVDDFLPPDVGRALRHAHERAMAGTEVVTQEYELVIKGRVQQFENRMIRREDGAVVSVVRNITEDVRRRLENERLRLEIAHAGRVVHMGYLTASLAHELSQPLSSALSNAQAAYRYLEMKSGDDVREMQKIVSDVIASILRAGAQVGRVRGFLKKEHRPYGPLNLNRLACEVALVLQGELSARRVLLVLELAPSVPDVMGDSVELQQVLLNLLLNGAEAMVTSLPTDRVLVLRTTVLPDKVQVSVCDRGPGVPEEHLERLFEPFFSTKPEGIGIGLCISADIVRAHGGTLIPERLEGRGMRFYFELAAVPDERERAR